MDDRTVQILLVEDDEVDAETVVRAVRRSRVANPITRVSDGLEALRLLRGEGHSIPLRRPFIILLDLSLPRMDGLELLDEIRGDDTLRDAVVVVLTGSDDPQHERKARDRGVIDFIRKSEVGESLTRLAARLESHWRMLEMPA